ncbi:MAG TPA: FkbM family methyltransferase, partial [Acidocella sp.]|nr:FkbM family methyltransferase [Acidocella sp.]
MKVVATRYGFMEIIESDSTVSKSLSFYGEWAQKELDLLARFILPGACVLDVGAFIGTHTLAFAHMAGATGKVYAFEPRREIFTYLQRNIEGNGLAQVSACNVALGAQPATLAMDGLDLLHAANFGGLALSAPRNTAAGEPYFVSVVTLDVLELPAVDLIKLDVEGMEADVLAGGGGLIARDRPVIFAECNSLDGGASLVDFARANSYSVFGGMSDAYNVANFNEEVQNIFGPAKELGLLLLPAEKLETYHCTLADKGLPEVESFDDLSCLLLSKPQYYDEVLAQFCAKYEVRPALPSHELDEALAAKGRCEAALNEVKELAFARQDEITVLSARIQTEAMALNEA